MSPETPRGWLPLLRAATGELHRRLDDGPFVGALRCGDATSRDVATFLWSMALLHLAAHRATLEVEDEGLRALGVEIGARGREAERDLALFDLHEVDYGAMRPVARAAEEILWCSKERPEALLGALYVLVGSRLGARSLSGLIARYSPEGATLRFFEGAQEGLGDEWRRLAAELERRDPADSEGACRLAEQVFEALLEGLGAVNPMAVSPRPTAILINAESGPHAIVAAPRPLVCALIAGIRCWRDFPYLEARYGRRGRRFTSSDSAWLATLAEASPKATLHKIRWLGRLLSLRGLPSRILEAHLVCLIEELEGYGGVDRPSLRALVMAAESLRRGRARCFHDADVARLEASFATTIDPQSPGSWAFEAPGLIVAAIADECNGIVGALAGLTRWLGDPKLFGEVWSEAVAGLIDNALDIVRR
ncbi:MAG: hypothetical protein R3B09_27635 [Nannocystaceae bacterium]